MTTHRAWRHMRHWAALLFAFSMVAAACGGSDSDDDAVDSDTETTAAPTPDDATEDDEIVGGAVDEDLITEALEGDEGEDEMMEDEPEDAMSEPGSDGEDEMTDDEPTLDAVFAAAAARRADLVAELTSKIEAGEYGVGDDNILRGAAGFEIDLNECPAGWSETTGVTASQIRIGHTTAQSGQLASYGNIAVGSGNYFDWINENQPIQVGGNDVEIEFIVKDDGYVATQTIEFVDELIENENVFAITTLGSPNTLGVYDTLNAECIPQPFVMTGHQAWGDPVYHPWTTGSLLSYSTEALMWGAWIRENMADQLPVKVAGLAMDNDFGLAYEVGFHDWVEANPDVVSEFRPVRHNPAAPTLTNEMTTISAYDPDVLILMTAGRACPLAISEASLSGVSSEINAKNGLLFTSQVCKAIEAWVPEGEAADGWWVVGGGLKDSVDPQYIDEPFIAFLNANLEAAGLDPKISNYAVGYTYGYNWVEALRVATELPGGLTRSNFILAIRSLSIDHPLVLEGIASELDGAADGYLIEGSDFSQFDADERAWRVDRIVDFNGESVNCAWNKDEKRCE